MFKRLLLWLSRSRFGRNKSPVKIWVRPHTDILEDGEVVFINTPLRHFRCEKFQGLAELRKLADYLQRPINLCAVRIDVDKPTESDILSCGDLTVLPSASDEELEEIAKIANRDLTYHALKANPNAGYERVPTFFVNRR